MCNEVIKVRGILCRIKIKRKYECNKSRKMNLVRIIMIVSCNKNNAID